jgi:hypothetical protein
MVLAFAGDSTITRFLVISRKLVKTLKTGTKVKQLPIQITFRHYRAKSYFDMMELEGRKKRYSLIVCKNENSLSLFCLPLYTFFSLIGETGKR